MEPTTLTESEVIKKINQGLMDSVPADVALDLYWYGYDKGYNEGVEDTAETYKHG